MRIIFFATLLGLSLMPAHGHQCILSGTDASEIAIYNACKNDLVMGLDKHTFLPDNKAIKTERDSERLILLESENRKLQEKLNLFRSRLLDLMKDL